MRGKVDFVVLENLLVDKRLEEIVDVVAAEMRVAVGGKNLENIAIGRGNQLEDRNIKSAAAEIVDGNAAALLFM